MLPPAAIWVSAQSLTEQSLSLAENGVPPPRLVAVMFLIVETSLAGLMDVMTILEDIIRIITAEQVQERERERQRQRQRQRQR
ncbi:hypothetical protein FS842_000421 [Serendipita sp. 407]|nr:hypothetical protein FS842_000421 [Serendipita sp. 407]